MEGINLTKKSEDFLEVLSISAGIILEPDEAITKLMLYELYANGLIEDCRPCPRPYFMSGKNVFAVTLTEDGRHYVMKKDSEPIEIKPIRIFSGGFSQ